MPPTESLIQRHEETVDPTFDLFNLVTRKQQQQQQQQQHHTDDNDGRKINKLKSSRSLPDLLDMDACREGVESRHPNLHLSTKLTTRSSFDVREYIAAQQKPNKTIKHKLVNGLKKFTGKSPTLPGRKSPTLPGRRKPTVVDPQQQNHRDKLDGINTFGQQNHAPKSSKIFQPLKLLPFFPRRINSNNNNNSNNNSNNTNNNDNGSNGLEREEVGRCSSLIALMGNRRGVDRKPQVNTNQCSERLRLLSHDEERRSKRIDDASLRRALSYDSVF